MAALEQLADRAALALASRAFSHSEGSVIPCRSAQVISATTRSWAKMIRVASMSRSMPRISGAIAPDVPEHLREPSEAAAALRRRRLGDQRGRRRRR